jgi:predicted lipid carrier protein YhbT
MSRASGRGALPAVVTGLLAPLPRFPLAFALTRAVRDLARRRPELFERLDAFAEREIAVMPSDLPFAFVVEPRGTAARVRVVDHAEAERAAARIRATLLVLLGLLDGTYDGDALFFTRDLVVEGDTGMVVALRNTIENAELTPAELAGLRGPLARLVDRAVGDGLGVARRVCHAPAADPQEI